MVKEILRLTCLVSAMLAGGGSAAQDLPRYQPVQQVTGVIRTWGSPQMGALLKAYEEGFRELQPGVRFEDDLKSTITAVAGVYTGRAEIGLLGREIWPIEEQAFESVKGHPATVVDIATASYNVPKATFALMIFVPKSNPIPSLSLAELERIFGRVDAQHRVRTWRDLGLTGAWANRPIHLYGFTEENDKSQIFAQLVFKRGERWSCDLHELANVSGGADAGESIVRAVAADPDAIGISNVFYASAEVKALPLGAAGAAPVAPTRENVATRAYPLTRAIYMVLNVDKNDPASPATAEFLRFVLSRQGADAVVKEGNYLPLTGGIAAAELKKLDPR